MFLFFTEVKYGNLPGEHGLNSKLGIISFISCVEQRHTRVVTTILKRLATLVRHNIITTKDLCNQSTLIQLLDILGK